MKPLIAAVLLLAALVPATAAPPPTAWYGTPAAIGEVDPRDINREKKEVSARIGQYPQDAAAWAELSRLYTVEGRFEDAQRAANRARALAATIQIQIEATFAQRRIDEIRALRASIPHIVALEPLGSSGRWAVLGARVGRSSSPWPQIAKAHLYVVEGSRVLWQVPIADPRLEGTPLNALRLVVSGSQVMVGTTMFGASWSPAALFIYDTSTLPAREILHAESDQPFGVEREAGGWIFRNEHAVGTSLAHVEQPRWVDFFAYDAARRRWIEDDRHHETAYTDLRGRIETALQSHPDDWELLLYRGRADEILGQRDAALEAYKRGITAASKLAGKDREAARGLAFMRARCKALGG